MRKKNSIETVAVELMEDQLYEIALEEIENSTYIKALWARAMEMAKGDRDILESTYISLRVKRLKDEIFISEKSAELQAKEELAKELDKREREKFSEQHKEMFAERDKNSPFAKYGFWSDPKMRYPGNTYIPLTKYAELKSISKDEVCSQVKSGDLIGKLFSMEPYIFVGN